MVPVAQARSRTKHYIEYVLVGVGPDSPSTGSAPCFLQTKHGHPTSKLRPKHCDQPIPGITAGVREQQGQICMIHAWARYWYLTHLPNPPRVLKTQKVRDDVDDMLGLLREDAQAAEDESSDSEGSVGPPTLGSDQESVIPSLLDAMLGI